MKHKYLNELGISSTECCIFNTDDSNDPRYTQLMEERERYGFDQRETWSLDLTLAGWLYCHLKRYLEVTIVDLTYHKFKVPVLVEIPKEERTHKASERYPDKYYKYAYRTKTLGECIELMLEYLEPGLTYAESVEEDTRNYEKRTCAFRILAEAHGSLWW